MENMEFQSNSLANNSEKREKKAATPFVTDSCYTIKELEISITNKCNLTCQGCGFNVPNQIKAVSSTGIEQHIESLNKLGQIGILINKIVLVGGEAALEKRLALYIRMIKETAVCQSIELVTNGLAPQGVTSEVLSQIDSLVISDYICTKSFEESWTYYLKKNKYLGEIDFRRKDAWDDLFGEVNNDHSETFEHWNKCFYRNYDVTLERGRLFSCSRIAKKGWDEQGLLINSVTSRLEIKSYLLSLNPKQACYSCATVANSSQIPVAEQTNTNIDLKVANAEKLLIRGGAQ